MRLTRKIWAVLGLVLLLAASACQVAPQVAQVRENVQAVSLKSDLPRQSVTQISPTDVSQLSEGDRAFAADLYRHLAAQDGNLIFSPYSISTSLAMMEAGARSATRAEIDRALHFDLPADRLHPAANALAQQLAQAAGGDKTGAFQFHSANAIWLQQGLDVEQSFLQTLAENYGDGVHALDFQADPEAARQVINRWVADQTAGKISAVLPPGGLSENARLALTGAVYFKGAWADSFSQGSTRDAPFHLSSGQSKTVPMMIAQSGSFKYAKEDGWQLVELPYASRSFSMDLLLPDPGQLASLEQSLTGSTLDSLLSQADYTSGGVLLRLPRFKFDSAFSLRETLGQMGLHSAFDPQSADFSGIHSGGGLFLDIIYHKAVISVDENGTEAAASTAISIPATGGVPAQPIEVTFDRPFLFLIREQSTGAVLFMGRVSNP